jgi:hypothetical protein
MQNPSLGSPQRADRLGRVATHLAIPVIAWVLGFMTSLPDYDLWARLAVGSIFFQTGSVPRQDIFSYVPTKSLWIDHEWGSGVVLYASARYFGEYGIYAVKALLLYLILMLVSKTIRVRDGKGSASILFYVLLGYALFPGVASLIRSQMFTYLFFALWLFGLERIRTKGRGMLWMFPCTMLLWVNLHGGFVAGLGLVVMYAIGELLMRRSPLPYLWILALIVPITLVNPYGPALWRYIVEASLMPRPLIPEWHPISLRGPMQIIGGVRVHFLTGYLVFVGLTAAVAVRSLLRRERLDWTRIICISALFLLSVRHQRHIVFFVLAVSALLHHRFVDLLDPVRKLIGRAFPSGWPRIGTAVRWGLGYALPAVILVGILPRLSYGIRVDYKRFPVGSFEFIRQNGISGNLATAFDWGSYALWKLYPECKVLIDGRYEEVYPDEVFRSAVRFSEKQEGWREVLKRFPTDVVVLPKANYRLQDLSLLPDWRPVYQDFVSVVLLPRDGHAGPFTSPDYTDGVYGRENLSKQIAVGPRGPR